MKKLCLIRFFLVLAAFRTAVKAENCTSNRKRLGANRGLRRYQPKTAFCARCQPLHRNLFLFGIEPKHSKVKKCFSVSQIELSHLQVQLPEASNENFIFIILNEDLVFEPEILTVLAETLGNVSMLLPKNLSNNELSKQCRSLGGVCYELNNLLPVLNQIRNTEFPQEHVVRKIDFDDWNDRDLGAKFDEMSFSIHKQLDRLINELCKRDISHNKLIRILKTRRNILANEGGIVEDFKGGLSLNDLLPPDSKSYDKNRPPKLDGHPTIVYFHVTVLSLDSINEESMTYVADIFLAQSWRDSRLRLPESMSEQYRILDVEWLRDIWRPDCFFKNAKQVTFHEISIPNHYVWLYHDKTLLYMSKLTLVLSCAMKFESYPHDIQVCSMMIESLSHTVQDLMFLWNTTDPLVVNPAIELPQLDISNNYTTDCTVQYSTGNFTCVAVVFNLKRRLGYHLLHTYIPSALIVVMSWISFWIKPEAIPARVTLGVTSLLTLATQNTQSQQSLPPVSYVKAIDIWMSSCSVFVFLSLMEFAIVNNYMGPVAMKAVAGYSEEDIRSAAEDYRSRSFLRSSLVRDSRHPTCYGKEAALCIDRFSSTPVMKSRVNSWKRLNESRTKLEEIIKKAERQGCLHSELVRLLGAKSLLEKAAKNPNRARRKPGKLLAITGIFCTFIYFSSIQTHQGFSTFWLEWIHEKKVEEQLCTITMPDEVVKIFRPPVACSICLGVTNVDKVANLFPEDFEERYAYTGRPVVVTDAMTNWTAQHVFDFDFFKKIYTKRMDRWATYNCQFFPYGTEFKHLSEVFNMSKDRALMAEGTTPWYVGWSNCDDEINEILRRHYQRPYFLPTTAETKKLDWIFMGSTGFGAPMHVDNVEHPSWQAQLRGRKKWKLQPPPECFYVCQTIQIIVEPGEIIVLDTNQWYHSTTIVSKEMSITIGAEYD